MPFQLVRVGDQLLLEVGLLGHGVDFRRARCAASGCGRPIQMGEAGPGDDFGPLPPFAATADVCTQHSKDVEPNEVGLISYG